MLGFFSVFKFFVRHFFTREDGNRGRARAVKSGSTELREIRTAGVLFFFFRREGGGDDDDDDFELFEKFARSFLEEKRSLAEGVFTSAFVSLLTMCLCRPWRLCFSSLSLSLSLSLLSSFFCSPYSSSLMFALSSRRHRYYRNRCICNKRKASSLYWKYGTRTI